jgi:DNA-binding CsgD family transcriptional regulator
MATAGESAPEARPAHATHEPAPLVEREREVGALERLLLAAARDRRGGVMVLEGVPGAGKSRLVELARHRAEAAEMAVLSARGSELEIDIPFGVVTQLFEPSLHRANGDERARLFSGMARGARVLFGELDDGRTGPAGSSQLELLHGLYWLLGNLAWPSGRDAPVPVLIAIDDAQLADGASLRFVMHLLVRVAELPLAILVAMRPVAVEMEHDGGAASETGGRLLAELRAQTQVSVLTLPRLSERGGQAVVRRDFADRDGRLAGALARASGGNPFLLTELIRAARAEGIAEETVAERVADLVPEAALRSLARRVQRLGPDAVAIARAAAILGDGAPLGQAADLAGMEPEVAERAAERLLAGQLLRTGDPLVLEHGLVGAAVTAELSDLARAWLHRRAAELLVDDGAPAGEISGHLLLARGRGSSWVVQTLRAAASEAQAHGEHIVAARMLGRALQEPPAAVLRDEVLLELAQAEAAGGQPAALDRLSDLLARLADPPRRARTLQALSQLLLARADYGLAAEAAERGLADVAADDPLAGGLLGLYLAASSFDPGRRFTQTARWQALLEEARHGHVPPEPFLAAQLAGAMAVRWGEPPDRVRWMGEAALAAEPAEPDTHGYVVSMAIAALVYVDELDAAESALAAAGKRDWQTGSPIGAAQLGQTRGLLLLRQGRVTAAVAEAERALEICRLGWTAHQGWCAAVLAHAHLERGDADGARRALSLAGAVDARSLQWSLVLEARGALALHEHDPASALEHFSAAGKHLEHSYAITNPMFLGWQPHAAVAAAQLGDRDAAARLAELATERAQASGRPRAIGVALHAAGRVTGKAAGLEQLTRAVAALERAPAPLELAHALLDLGTAMRAAGRRTDAREALSRGLELATSCDARPMAERAYSELRLTGARPRRPSRTGVAALTPTELRIARLAAAGATNPAIAQQLFITTKTVEWHLTNAYRKLGVDSRDQLATHLPNANQMPSA